VGTAPESERTQACAALRSLPMAWGVAMEQTSSLRAKQESLGKCNGSFLFLLLGFHATYVYYSAIGRSVKARRAHAAPFRGRRSLCATRREYELQKRKRPCIAQKRRRPSFNRQASMRNGPPRIREK
jgi:hypothetical protein